jgi:hypothetical protein
VGSPKLSARFWRRADRAGGPDACWPWTGYILRGYGRLTVRVDGRAVGFQAPRLALILDGRDPGDGEARHLCHNSLCVNPAHLAPGSRQQNEDDKVAAGRQARKLEAEQVRDALGRRADGETFTSIAADLGVSESTVRKAARGDTWRHVQAVAS